MPLWALAFATSLAGVGCGDDTTDPAIQSGADVTQDTVDPDPRSRGNICARWTADRADRREGRWSGGSTVSCNAGDLDALGVDNTLRQVNLVRWLAELPPVAVDVDKNAAAQACALIMDANDDIEHDVPDSWRCKDPIGAAAAQVSNLATTPGVFAIDLYMDDEGIANLGHRRWILNRKLGPIGVGSTKDYSCLHVIGGTGSSDAPWTAWPPPGFVPKEAIHQANNFGGFDIDRAGWSVQSDAIDVSEATVTVTRDGLPVTVTTRVLGAGFGSRWGIGIWPKGFNTKNGGVFNVLLETPRENIEYTFEVVDCGL